MKPFTRVELDPEVQGAMGETRTILKKSMVEIRDFFLFAGVCLGLAVSIVGYAVFTYGIPAVVEFLTTTSFAIYILFVGGAMLNKCCGMSRG